MEGICAVEDHAACRLHAACGSRGHVSSGHPTMNIVRWTRIGTFRHQPLNLVRWEPSPADQVQGLVSECARTGILKPLHLRPVKKRHRFQVEFEGEASIHRNKAQGARFRRQGSHVGTD